MPRVTSQPSSMPMATPATASAIMTARTVSYRSVPSCTDCAATFSLLTDRSVIRSSSFWDDTITRFSISATRGSAGVNACDCAAAKNAADSRFQTCSVSANWASRRLPSSAWKLAAAFSRSASMFLTASSNCFFNAWRSWSLEAAR
ncbi:hypothetical protein G6F32_014647 [Rhizopus arrhizus]|nr:hypothetical protein G6F32_014647 [Rhizopus arrhizus]